MKRNILILCDFDEKSPNTTIDYVGSFKKYSRHNVFYYNPVERNKPAWLSLDKFDVIIIHYSIYILWDNYLNQNWRRAIIQSPAVKALFLQDEYRTVNAFHEKIKELKITLLFTCIPESETEKIYPSGKLPGVKKINVLTGYVPEYLAKRKPDFDASRPIDVGYRARGIGFWWLGALYQEKSIIGKEFLKFAQGNALKCDISSREEDRIYGKAWINFLKNCRCILGTESGASVVDFSGEIENNVKNYCRANPAATFEETSNLFLKDAEGRIKMNQISPRIFEAIGCGGCLVLFEGEYSGILRPGIHYIELKKDFSNIRQVISKIKDRGLTTKTAKQAYNDVIGSGKYSYKKFIVSVDKHLEVALDGHADINRCAGKSLNRSASKTRTLFVRLFHVLSDGINSCLFVFKETAVVLKQIIFTTGIFRLFFKRKVRMHLFFTAEKIRLLVQAIRLYD